MNAMRSRVAPRKALFKSVLRRLVGQRGHGDDAGGPGRGGSPRTAGRKRMWSRIGGIGSLIAAIVAFFDCAADERYHVVRLPHDECLDGVPPQAESFLKRLEQNCRENEGTPRRVIRWGTSCDGGGRRAFIGIVCNDAFVDESAIPRRSAFASAGVVRRRVAAQPHEEPRKVYSASEPFGTIQIQEILAAHDAYRKPLGLASLAWDVTLAAHAKSYADHLAATSTFDHNPALLNKLKEGENLWKGTAGYFTLTKQVDSWGAEKQNFRYGPMPSFQEINTNTVKVSTTGKFGDIGHYTQMVWRATTHVGCGAASDGTYDYLVCRYSPPGNYPGQKPY